MAADLSIKIDVPFFSRWLHVMQLFTLFSPPILHFKVIDPINKLLDTVEFDSVFYSLDWHPSDHVSFIDNIKQRPIHPTSPVRFTFFLLIGIV